MQAQSVRFRVPVEGDLGTDVIVVNHVDHDTTQGKVRDYRCDVYTYDGHDGTDFVLRSFRAMDAGVAVLAAADGVVIAAIDSLYDRNKVSVVERGFGNYVALRHADGYVTYYAHIRTGSAKVVMGQHVRAGDALALVGSSGNSTDPHVHFEVLRRTDPFGGACADNKSLWEDQLTIDRTYKLLDHGITTWPPLLDTIRERPPNTRVIDTAANTITAWSLQSGVSKGDEFSVSWFMPSGAKWFDYQYTSELTTNYMYWWSFIDYTKGTMPSGDWVAVMSVKGAVVSRDTFAMPAVVSVDEESHKPHPIIEHTPDIVITNLLGEQVGTDIRHLPNGTYVAAAPGWRRSVQLVIRDGVVFGVSY
jgi:hypothetical protein